MAGSEMHILRIDGPLRGQSMRDYFDGTAWAMVAANLRA
jgi:hypothetical protein